MAERKKNCEMNAIKRTFVLIFACGLIYMVDILIRSWQRDYWWHPISFQWLMFGITANVISVTSPVNYIPIIQSYVTHTDTSDSMCVCVRSA